MNRVLVYVDCNGAPERATSFKNNEQALHALWMIRIRRDIDMSIHDMWAIVKREKVVSVCDGGCIYMIRLEEG